MEEKNVSMEQPNALEVQVTEVIKEENGLNQSQKVENIGTNETADGSIGKFKNTESLLNAYNNLQAEFTRKCQRLAEFENNAKSQAGSITFADTQEVLEFVKSNSELQNRLVTDFLTANKIGRAHV